MASDNKLYVYLIIFVIGLSIFNLAQIHFIKKNAVLNQKQLQFIEAYLPRPAKAVGQSIINRKRLDLLYLQKTIENSISNFPNDKFERAIVIRNHIYRNVKIPPDPKLLSNTDSLFIDLKLQESYDKFLRGTDNDKPNYIVCGAIAAMYIAALEANGIPARGVALFSSSDSEYESHQSVEFWFNGKWYASDPTFNIMIMHNNNYVSYQELYNIVDKDLEYSTTTNGFSLIENKDLKTYYISLNELMKYIVIYPNKVWMDGQLYNYEKVLLPEIWDGVISGLNYYKRVDDDLDQFNYYLSRIITR